jgi:hypothetical protein
MKTRAILVIIVGLVLAYGLAIFCWPRDDKRPVRLKITRRAIEQGKPVVFFRLVGANGRRIRITDVQRVVGALNDGPFEAPGIWTPTENFWSPSQEWPLLDPKKGRREFGLCAPTNTQSWKVKVTVNVENIGLGARLSNLRKLWKPLRKCGSSFLRATWSAWGAFTILILISSKATQSPIQ